jgi:hypothetical protein
MASKLAKNPVTSANRVDGDILTVEPNSHLDKQITIDLSAEGLQKMINNAQKFKKQRKAYPDEMKIFAIALRATGKSYKDIQKIIGVQSHTTICEWINDPSFQNIEVNELTETIKKGLSNRLVRGASFAYNKALEDKRVEKSSTLQLTTAGSQMIDKHMLLEGKTPPQNVFMFQNNVDKTKNRIVDVDAEIRDLEAQLSPPGQSPQEPETPALTDLF